ncbi:MAG TPA: glycerol kinase GlpK [Thermotogota bacterium]|nr:glycerol kinase GlpK [Thermotogota bacterium]HRW92181.1 glycerol kinase GlpK [Thermotogota bacterium]
MKQKKGFIAAIDQGTTSSRTIVFDQDLQVVASAQLPFEQFYPRDGWVEHDPMEILKSVQETLLRATEEAGLEVHELGAIGITNQRETVVAWNRETGEPLYNAIVWQCRRTASRCEELRGKEKEIHEKTGLIVDPYFSATKMEWLLENVPRVRIAAQAGELALGTIDSWLVYNLSRKRVHVSDVSNASRTMLFNISQLQWDEELLQLFGIKEEWLPRVVPTSSVVGYTREGVPIASIVGDQQGALFGQMALEPGQAKCTYGTGSFLLLNLGEKMELSQNRLLTTVGWKLNGKTVYAMEGSLFMCGAAVDWAVDELGLAEKPSDTEQMAYNVRDNGGVYFVPALAGLGAPHWNPGARGLFIGMTQSSNRNHMVRAILESITFGVREIFDTMEQDCGIQLQELRIDGGVSKNVFVQNFQSTVLGLPVVRPVNTESTATGAAMLAGLAVGLWEDTDSLKKLWAVDREINRQKEKEVELQFRKWKRAVELSKNWV